MSYSFLKWGRHSKRSVERQDDQIVILILSDLYFLDKSLDLSSVDLCVHYDIPSDSQTKFKKRFLHSKKAMTSFYEKAVQPEPRASNFHLFITKSGHELNFFLFA